MNDPRSGPVDECPSPETLRWIAECAEHGSGLAASVIQHLERCARCRRELDGLDPLPLGIDELRTVWDNSPHVDMATLRSRCMPCLPGWRSLDDGVQLEAGLRLGPPRESPYTASLGRFDVARLLGRGGMGYVLEGYDPVLCRRVALKVIKPKLSADPRLREMLRDEARAAAGLQHPHVVIVHDLWFDDQPPFLVMELVQGHSLAWLIDAEGRLAADRAAQLSIEVLSVLGYAHERGMIHRDVKPSNVMLDGRFEIAKLADFGLARKFVDPLAAEESCHIAGTPSYMSPEQASGSLPCDGRSDLFAMGVVLFRMLTGQLPFTGASKHEILDAIRHRPPVDLRQFCPAVPEALIGIVQRALQKSPAERYPSAAAFSEDLQRFLDVFRPVGEQSTETWSQAPSADTRAVLGALVEMAQARPPFRARVWIDRRTFEHTRDILTVARDSRDCCRIGELFSLRVEADEDCYVTLIDVGTSGNVVLLLQNHPLHARKSVALSGPDDRREWLVGGPAGIEQIKALFTKYPLDLFPETGPFQPVSPRQHTRDIVTRIKRASAKLQDMPAGSWTDASCRFLVEADEGNA